MRYYFNSLMGMLFTDFYRGVVTMNSKMGVLWVSVLVAVVLWLLGGLVFSKEVGMVCVILGIAIVGWGAGNAMNSPCTTSKEH